MKTKFKKYKESKLTRIILLYKAIRALFTRQDFCVVTIGHLGINKFDIEVTSTLPLLECEVNQIAAEVYEGASANHRLSYEKKILDEAKEIIK